MYAVNIKIPEKVFLLDHTIIKFPAYFNRTIFRKKRDQVLTNQKIDKLGQGQSSHHMIIFLSYKTHQQFLGKRVIKF